ncbi:MAG: hypothetical protein JNM12_02025 [Alphaproteobacteria bacterium]|nr:hypothetical protein [Alphaproteobacteria bacterium]
MENKQSQNPSKAAPVAARDTSIDKKSASKTGAGEFDIETKHPSARDGEVMSGAGKDSGSCATSGSCGTKQ